MKVIFFNSTKKWGGGEKWHAEMTSALNSELITPIGFAHKNSLLFHKFQDAHIKLNATRIRPLSFLNPYVLAKLFLQFRKTKADAIIINLPTDLKTAGLAAKLAGIKRIIYRRGSAIPIKNRWTNRIVFKYIVTEIIANSHETARTILAHNAQLISKEKIHIIYNGIKTNLYFNTPINEFNKNSDSPIILGNLARLSFQKGQHFLIDLAQNLLSKGKNFKIRIGGEGELEQELKTLVKKNKLEHVIEFCGFIANPYEFLNQVDVFVFPSIWEGFGFSIVEAKLAKKPIIAFDVSSNPEVIQNETDGFLVPLNNMDEFTNATLRIMDNPTLAKTMGEAGHTDVLKRFTHERSVENLMKFLL
jgi:glycosyltransferase involved in cell wall biosynthesis